MYWRQRNDLSHFQKLACLFDWAVARLCALVGAALREDGGDRLEHDLNVKQQTLAFNILNVQVQAIIKIQIAAAAHLPQARQARYDL